MARVAWDTIRYTDLGNGTAVLSWTSACDYSWIVIDGKLHDAAITDDFAIISNRDDYYIEVVESDSIDYDYTQDLAEQPENRIQIAWNASTDSDIDYFKIYGGEDNPPTGIIAVIPYDSDRYIYSVYVDNLDLGFYFFKVIQVDTAGNESTCTTAEIWIDTYPNPPAAISDSYAVGTKKMTLTWTASVDL